MRPSPRTSWLCLIARRNASTEARMPVLSDLETRVTVDDVVASWRSRGTRPVPRRMMALLETLLAQIEAQDLIRPRLGFRVWPIESSRPSCLELRGGSRITSRNLTHHLPGALVVATGVCTVGPALEKEVSERFAAGDRLRAVMLDEIGTLALFRLSDRLEGEIQAEASHLGLQAGGVLNPGDDGFDISQQATIVELANGRSIGITNTEAMLVPRKSVSMLVGMGVRMPRWSRGERCAVCAARDRCPHRRSRTAEVSR